MEPTFKVKLKGSREYFEKVQKALHSTVKAAVMRDLGKLGREILYNRVKSGYGVSDDTDKTPVKSRLLKLSPGYVKYRSKFTLGPFGKTGKSNLTFTGEMLESIKVEARRNGFALAIPNSTRSDGNTNAGVADEVRKNGRPFFAFTAAEQVVLFRELEKILRNEFRKILGSKSVR